MDRADGYMCIIIITQKIYPAVDFYMTTRPPLRD